jgi:hypothetical protein
MRLGFDLDGTLADLQGALAREARRLFPDIDPSTLPRSVGPPPEETKVDENAPPFSMSALPSRQQRALWDAACSSVNFWETLDELEPGALVRLSRLARERRWEVIFLTSRPETSGDTAQLQTQRWLAAHGFELPSVFVVHGSRGKIAASLALDVLVDDRPENCLDVAIDSTTRAILVWRDAENTVPSSARQLGIGAVGSISECLQILEALDREAQDVGIVDRFRQLLGLKASARKSDRLSTNAPAATPESTKVASTAS